jgi:repressor LexA
MNATQRKPPARKQREVLEYVTQYIAAKGYSPTLREIQRAFTFKSVNAVMSHLLPLRDKGWLTWQEGQARTIRPVEVQG